MSLVSQIKDRAAEGTRWLLLSLGLLLLRVGAGGLIAYAHGWDKLSHFSEKAANFGDPLHIGPRLSLGLVTFAEFFCAIAIILGLATRFAAVPLVIAMGVAAFLVHLPLVMALQVVVMDWPLHWTIKFPLIVMAASGLLLLSYMFFVRGTFIGAWLNGRSYPR